MQRRDDERPAARPAVWLVWIAAVVGVVLVAALLFEHYAMGRATAQVEALTAREDIGAARQGARLFAEALASAPGEAAISDLPSITLRLDQADVRWETVVGSLRSAPDEQSLADAAKLVAEYREICSGWLDQVGATPPGSDPDATADPCAAALQRVQSQSAR